MRRRRTWNLSRKRLKSTTKPATRLEGGYGNSVLNWDDWDWLSPMSVLHGLCCTTTVKSASSTSTTTSSRCTLCNFIPRFSYCICMLNFIGFTNCHLTHRF